MFALSGPLISQGLIEHLPYPTVQSIGWGIGMHEAVGRSSWLQGEHK